MIQKIIEDINLIKYFPLTLWCFLLRNLNCNDDCLACLSYPTVSLTSQHRTDKGRIIVYLQSIFKGILTSICNLKVFHIEFCILLICFCFFFFSFEYSCMCRLFSCQCLLPMLSSSVLFGWARPGNPDSLNKKDKHICDNICMEVVVPTCLYFRHLYVHKVSTLSNLVFSAIQRCSEK